MAKSMKLNTSSLLIILLLFFTSPAAAYTYNILSYGAKPDGRTDAARALVAAWTNACNSFSPSSVIIPTGKFFVSRATFSGPCRNRAIKIFLSGTLVAPYGYTNSIDWLLFKFVEGVSVIGSGTIDGQGRQLWNCRTNSGKCPAGASSLSFKRSKNILIRGITSTNSEMFHINIFGSSGVIIQEVHINAPWNSPNTDGIHVQMSSGVTISSSYIKTGDDCISMGEGSQNVWIQNIDCGPGHGISIGSLGRNADEAEVRNITVKSTVFTGTMNGLRIKTWGSPFTGSVMGVAFEDAIMNNVGNPIIIDQNYCPNSKHCPGKSSGVRINGVTYRNIRGTSAAPVAVKLDCSRKNPCRRITLHNINLVFRNYPTKSFSRNAYGRSTGTVIPPTKLW